MSEDPKPEAPASSTPAVPAPAPAAPAAATPAPAGGSAPATPATPSTAPMAPKPPVPTPIDYAIGAPKKPFTLPRYTFLFIKMIFGLIVVLCMGYFALVALNPKARQWATQGGKDGSGGPTPFKSINQILAIPAQAVGKTKDVVAASDARTGMVNKVVAEEEDKAKGNKTSRPLTDIFSKPAAGTESGAGKSAAGDEKDPNDQSVSRERLLALAEKNASAAVEEANKPAPPRVAPAAPPPPPGPAEMNLGGGITITNVPAPDATPASAPFMYWVAGLSVSGVSNSTPARFLMNGKLVREGDEVNRALAITFERLDATAKVIYFRDKSGAGVTRSY